MSEPLKKCPACSGLGYFRCDCWPADCICGLGDETCEECGGEGIIDTSYDDFDPSVDPIHQLNPPAGGVPSTRALKGRNNETNDDG